MNRNVNIHTKISLTYDGACNESHSIELMEYSAAFLAFS